MAILKAKDAAKMNEKDRNDRMKDLKMELLKLRVGGKKSGKASFKEIRRAIARIMTFNSMDRIEKNKQKEEKKETKREIKSKVEAKR